MAALGGAARTLAHVPGGALAGVAVHDLAIGARDGTDIAVRVTKAVGRERGLLVFHNGTAAGPQYFDGMAAALADRGITSYSVGARTLVGPNGRPTTGLGHGIHSDDLGRVVHHALSLHEHAGVPAAIGGSSFGASVAMYYNAVSNLQGLPVLAVNPVVLDRFLPFADKAKLAASFVADRAAAALVNTPMSRGVPLTTNPESLYIRLADQLAHTKVPAAVFRDVAEMDVAIMAKGTRGAAGKVKTVFSGRDRVGFNVTAWPLSHLAAPSRLRLPTATVEGAAHDLSQAWDRPDVVDIFERLVIDHGRSGRGGMPLVAPPRVVAG